jgi:hypothetical protein
MDRQLKANSTPKTVKKEEKVCLKLNFKQMNGGMEKLLMILVIIIC